jgi:hypothetical protein
MSVEIIPPGEDEASQLEKRRINAMDRSPLLSWTFDYLYDEVTPKSKAIISERFKEMLSVEGYEDQGNSFIMGVLEPYVGYAIDLGYLPRDVRASERLHEAWAHIVWIYLIGYEVADMDDCDALSDVAKGISDSAQNVFVDEAVDWNEKHEAFWIKIMQDAAKSRYISERPPHVIDASRDFWDKNLKNVDMSALDGPTSQNHQES